MASGSGLNKDSVRIPESEYPIVDIVSCFKFEDVYGFFSLKEALQSKKRWIHDRIVDNYKLTDQKISGEGSFIYPSEARVGSEMKRKLKSGEDYVSVRSDITDRFTGVKISIKADDKRIFEDMFASRTLIEAINKRGGKLPTNGKFGDLNYMQFFGELDKAAQNFVSTEKDTDAMLKKINRSLLKEGRFQLLRVIAKRAGRKEIETTLQTVREGMIHPTDLKKLQERFVDPSGRGSYPIYLMKNSLPRFCSAQLLIEILNGKTGGKTIYGGRRCWNITNKSLEGKKALALFPNIEVDDSSMTVSNVNLGLFLKKEVCNGEKYEMDDKIIGYLEGGYYQVITSDMLKKSEREQVRFFQSNFGKMEQELVTSSFINGIKKKFKYPKKTESLLLMREETFTPSFDKSENSSKEYINGFYNSFGRGSGIDIQLKKELVRFILFRYVGRDGKFLMEERGRRKEAKEIMLKMEKDVERGQTRSSFLGGDKVSKRDIVKLIELFTYRREEKNLDKNSGIASDAYRYGTGKALRNFLADPNIRFGTPKGEEFPFLRSISYFVMCEYNNVCDSIFDIGERGTFQSISYLKIPGDETAYSLYYDKQNKYFTQNYR